MCLQTNTMHLWEHQQLSCENVVTVIINEFCQCSRSKRSLVNICYRTQCKSLQYSSYKSPGSPMQTLMVKEDINRFFRSVVQRYKRVHAYLLTRNQKKRLEIFFVHGISPNIHQQGFMISLFITMHQKQHEQLEQRENSFSVSVRVFRFSF